MSDTDSNRSGEEGWTEEARVLAQTIAHEMVHDPAIVCPFTFIWSGNQELADQVGMSIRIFGLLMRNERPGTSFAALRGITFHHDYEQGLRDVAGLRAAEFVPTKEAGAISLGMMVRVDDGVHLVMHESVALALASDEAGRSDWANQIVRHELCHVADFAFKKRLIQEHPDQCTYGGFDTFAAPLAESLWDEFYANKYSFGPWTDPSLFLHLLHDASTTIRAEVIDAILAYRVSWDLDALMSVVRPKAKYVAQCFGYVAGVLSALETTLAEQAPEEYALLKAAGWSDAWNCCFEAVCALDARHPNWDSVLDLKRLFPGSLAVFSALGLILSPDGEGAYVDVPFTAETHPHFARMWPP